MTLYTALVLLGMVINILHCFSYQILHGIQGLRFSMFRSRLLSTDAVFIAVYCQLMLYSGKDFQSLGRQSWRCSGKYALSLNAIFYSFIFWCVE